MWCSNQKNIYFSVQAASFVLIITNFTCRVKICMLSLIWRKKGGRKATTETSIQLPAGYGPLTNSGNELTILL